jgi:hypothetical protein
MYNHFDLNFDLFMQQNNFARAAWLMLGLVAATLVFCEVTLRQQGEKISYDDGPSLWADKRAKVYQPSDQATVVIGSSRIKFDLDLATWKKQVGHEAVELAIEGSSPLPILEDLANDPQFKGRLIVDVTEGLFFSNSPPSMEKPNEFIKYYHERTPAQQASFVLNRWLESKCVFLDKDQLSLNARLDALEIPSRPGVFMMPIFPFYFSRNNFDRQMYMTNQFVADTGMQHRVSAIWQFFGKMAQKAPPMPQEALEAIFQSAKTATDKIKARGGEVIFVRTPSSGPSWMGEQRAFPRDKFWDRLLALTGCQGIHFADYQAIANFICPEDSHLTPDDAVEFTRVFVDILAEKTSIRR